MPDSIETPHPRFGRDRWPQRLAGQAVTGVDAHGKHLFIRFENALVIHSHLRMTGKWRVRDADWPTPRNTWLVIRSAGQARRPDQRPGAGADDAQPRRASTAASPASARTSSPRSSTRQAFLRRLRDGRPDAPDRRRPARPAHHRRDRQPVEGRGLLRGRDRPVAAHRRRQRRGGAQRSSTPPARACRSRRATACRTASRSSTAPPAQPCPRCGEPRTSAHAGRETTTGRHTGVHDVSDERADRTQGRGPDRPRQHARLLRRRARPRRRHDRVRRAARDQHEPDKGRLLLAHDYEHVDGAPTLEDGLAHLACAPFDGVELDVDLKLPGYEERVVDALREHGLVERTLVSSNWMRSLIVLRELEPRLRLGWSVPRLQARTRRRSWLTKLPAYAGAAYVRAKLPSAVKVHMAAGRCDALMCHWRLVTPRLVQGRATRRAASSTCGRSTTAARIGRLEKLGVTGVITNDPRLFGQLPERAGRGGVAGRVGARARAVPGLGRDLGLARQRVAARQRKRTTPRSVTGLDGLREGEAPAGLDRRRPWRAPTHAPAGVGVLDVRPRRPRRPGTGRGSASRAARPSACRASTRGCRSRPAAWRCRRR